jgi:hypothetical protein
MREGEAEQQPKGHKEQTMKLKTLSTLGAGAVLLGSVAVAHGDVSHILGSDGPQVKLDAMCHRSVVLDAQKLRLDINVNAQQIKCLIRRPDPFAQCVRRLGVPPIVKERSDHGPGKPGDEIGAARLAGYVASIYACSHARLK